MPTPERISQREYHKRAWTQLFMKLSLKYDADIIEKLENEENIAGYVRRLIREDIAREAEEDASK